MGAGAWDVIRWMAVVLSSESDVSVVSCADCVRLLQGSCGRKLQRILSRNVSERV